MSKSNEAVYPTKERALAPFEAMVTYMEAKFALGKGTEEDRQLVSRAKESLAQLHALVPSAQEVLDDYFSAVGPLEAFFDRAQKDAWREEAASADLTKSLRDETLQSIRILFNDLARDDEAADAAFALVQAKIPLLEMALDEAQADGWKRGDYASQMRDDLVDRFAQVVLNAARGLI